MKAIRVARHVMVHCKGHLMFKFAFSASLINGCFSVKKRCSLFFIYFCSLKTNKNGNVYFHFSLLLICLVPNSKIILRISLITIWLHLIWLRQTDLSCRRRRRRRLWSAGISQVVKTRGEGDSAARGAGWDCQSRHRGGKKVKVGAALEAKVKSRMVALLKEYVDIFA